jgi:2-amino-4-hydroxy-6-hydroxymethyldihydropteridine diphosphokinase
MTHIFLALGANVGDKKEHIEKAIELLSQKVSNIMCAPLYESKAVGFTDQDNFVNTVVSGDTELPPKELLQFVKGIEQTIGRIYRFRWGPREIDIDIIFYGDMVFHDDGLEIPHPRMQERDFVLKPLCDLDDTVMHPVLKKTARELYDALPKSELAILQAMK